MKMDDVIDVAAYNELLEQGSIAIIEKLITDYRNGKRTPVGVICDVSRTCEAFWNSYIPGKKEEKNG